MLQFNYFYFNSMNDYFIYIFFSFREDLRCISEKIHKRNEKLEKKYDYLLPEDIPNSISA